jgi:hypothetical protein
MSERAGRDQTAVALVLIASLLATIPVWIPAFPPMTDLPQHAAQVALLRAIQSPDFPFASLFQINWFTPYWFGHLLIYALVPLAGMVGALKLVIAGSLVGLSWAATVLMKETGTDRRWALLTIPGMYGFSYQWGFLSFIVAAPLGVYVVALAFRQARDPRPRRAAALALLSLVLFFSHALAWAFFGAIAGLILLSSATTLAMAVRLVAPLMVVFPLVLLWVPRMLAHPVGAKPMDWMFGWYRLPGTITWMFGYPSSAFAVLAALVIAALPLAAGGTFRRSRAWIPLVVCVAALAFAPYEVLGTSFVFPRFAWFLLPFYFIAFDAPRRRDWPRWTWPACLIVAVSWIGVVTMQVRHYQKESATFGSVLAAMAPGQRAVWFAFEPYSSFADAPPYLHFGSWYTALKGGLTEPSMAAVQTTAVWYKPEHLPAIRPIDFEWHPSSFDWKTMGGAQYRYFVARSSTDPGPLISRGATCEVRLTYHVDDWWLYERDPACRAR